MNQAVRRRWNALLPSALVWNACERERSALRSNVLHLKLRHWIDSAGRVEISAGGIAP
jgi:hypothetical protein